jgi:oxalate decarboxylase/phosphoglucose isomerase-like protein (cupin superfamily)
MLAWRGPAARWDGTHRRLDQLPAASTIAAALVEVEPGGLRELHRHTNTDEWQYFIDGTSPRSSARARAED